MIFRKQTKCRIGTYLNTNEIALVELKAKAINENTNKSTKFWLEV